MQLNEKNELAATELTNRLLLDGGGSGLRRKWLGFGRFVPRGGAEEGWGLGGGVQVFCRGDTGQVGLLGALGGKRRQHRVAPFSAPCLVVHVHAWSKGKRGGDATVQARLGRVGLA